MKLIIAIIQDDLISKVSKVLMDNKIRTTKLASTGGFLKAGNTTLVIGVENDEIEKVVSLIEGISSKKNVNEDKDEVNVRGANLFVIDIDQYIRL